MYIPKRYGQSKMENCPFCGKHALTKNAQGIPVCQSHKNSSMHDMKCACGRWLDAREGKWGPYFQCTSCGNISFRKAMEMNPRPSSAQQKESTSSDSSSKDNKKEYKPREITVTSDELDFLY